MAFTPDDPATIAQSQLASYSTRFTGRDTSAESFLGKISRAEAQGLWAFQKKLQRVSLDTVPNSQSTYDALSTWATTIGLSDGQGGYGPYKATAATGLVATASGTVGKTISGTAPNAAQIVAADGTTMFVVSADAVIGAGGTASVSFDAVTKGTVGNLQTPAALTLVSPPLGVQASLVLTTGATNGTDQEASAPLLARILNRLQLPIGSGTQNNWNTWVKDALDSVDVYGYAHRNGLGSVDEVVTNTGASGINRQVSNAHITTIETALDLLRPVTTSGRRVLTPYMPAAHALTIRTRIVPYPGGAFDWDDTNGAGSGLPYLVFSYTSPSPLGAGYDRLVLGIDAPQSLIDAVSLGTLPRVQIASSGTNAPIVALQAQVFAYASVGGHAQLDVVAGWIPSGVGVPHAGDAVYAGSSAVPYVGASQLAYIDALGPSVSSGLNDPNTAWDDAVECEKLGAAALASLDSNGAKIVKNIYKSSGVPQILIAVGSGSPTIYDFQPGDTYTDAPELAYAKHIVVTD